MGYHVVLWEGESANCIIQMVGPAFTPRKAGEGAGTSFRDVLMKELNGKAPGVDDLSAQWKDILRGRLHNGRGDLTLQEWDNFLADLVDLGLLTNDERFFANGIMSSLPDAARGGEYTATWAGPRGSREALSDFWNGNPLDFLEQRERLLQLGGMTGQMDRMSAAGEGNERDAYRKVAQIVKDLLA